MTDVNKVQGPSGAPDNLGKKDTSGADADKFKEAMRKRVSEVSKTDPDEQKKRKRGEEAEEEEEMTLPEDGPATPKEQVTPFSLGEGAKKASPMEKRGRGISPMQSAQPTPSSTESKKEGESQGPFSSEQVPDDEDTEEKKEAKGGGLPSKATEKKPPPPLSPVPQEQAPTKLPQEEEPLQGKGKPAAFKISIGGLELETNSKADDTSAFFEQMSPLGKQEAHTLPLEEGSQEEVKPVKDKEAAVQGGRSSTPF